MPLLSFPYQNKLKWDHQIWIIPRKNCPINVVITIYQQNLHPEKTKKLIIIIIIIFYNLLWHSATKIKSSTKSKRVLIRGTHDKGKQ